MADMIAYIATFELPDGEHVAGGISQTLQTARLHFDGYILNRRRALFPDEKARLTSIRRIEPGEMPTEMAKEKERIAAKYPNREAVEDRWDEPNRILDNRVTDDPKDI